MFALYLTVGLNSTYAAAINSDGKLDTVGLSSERAPAKTYDLRKGTESGKTENQISSAREEAVFYEKAGNPLAAQRYFRLAEMDCEHQLADAAIADARHGLQLYRRSVDSIGFSYGMFFSNSDILESARLAALLVKLGRAKGAEMLIDEVMIATNKAFGSSGSVAAQQVSQLFTFFVAQKRESDALKTLDRLLQFDLRTLEIGQTSPLQRVTECARSLDQSGDAKLALVILNKILVAQKKTFDLDDKRIADTLVEIAQIQGNSNQNEEAEKNLLNAAETYKLYVGPMALTCSLSGAPLYKLLELWKKMGRLEEAKTVEAGYWSVSPALLKRLGNEDLAMVISETGKVPNSYIDPCFPFENNRRSFDRHADVPTKIEQLQTEYRAAIVDAPYGRRAISALDELMDLALKQKDWTLLADSATARCKIYEHTPDENAGRSFICIPPRNHRMDYYRYAVQAYLHLNRESEAQKWLDRAAKNLPEKTYGEYFQLADLELKCKNPSLASNYTEGAENQFTAQYQAINPVGLCQLWKRLGHPERAEVFFKKVQEMRAESDAQTKNAQKSHL